MEIGKQPGVVLKPIGRSKDIACAAEFDQNVACVDDAGNISRSNMIRTAGDDRRTFRKPGGRRRLPVYRANDFMRRLGGWQGRRIDMAKGDEIGCQGPGFQGQEAGLEGPVLLNKSVAGEFPVDKVVRSEDGGYPLKDMVLVPLNPAQFVRNELLVDAVPRELEEIRRINFFFDFCHLGAGTPVTLLN